MNFNLLEKMGLANIDLSITILAILVMIVVALVIAIFALARYNNLNKKYQKFMGGNEAKSLESYITELISLNNENISRIDKNAAEIRNLYKRQRLNFQKIGLIKYDALQEMGGNMSFVLALLDENNSGFILNSVHNIHSNYCYAKEIKEGKCSIPLSEEEQAALEKALTNR